MWEGILAGFVAYFIIDGIQHLLRNRRQKRMFSTKDWYKALYKSRSKGD